MKAGAADVAALGRFATSASLQPSLDESALKLCGRTHDLAKESPLRIVRIIPYDLGTLGGLEDTDVIPGSPGARESDLLDVKLACQPVWSMHDQALGEAVVKSNKRGREAGAVLDPERTAQNETTDSRLLGAYQWALVPTGQPIEIQATKVEGQAASLAERVSRRLGNDGALTIQHAAPAIRHQLDTTAAKLWADGHVTVGALWRLYAEYPYMPRLRDRAVLDAGLTGPQLLWEQEGFALADGYDEATAKYRALVLPTEGMTVAVTDATLIVRPERAKVQRAAEVPDEPPVAAGPGEGSWPDAGAPQPSPPSPGKTRFFGSKRLQADRYASDFKKLADEVPSPLGATPGVTLNVTIEIEATTTGGFDDAKIRTVSENAATLKFEQSGFEEG